jgi:hypothetical protein
MEVSAGASPYRGSKQASDAPQQPVVSHRHTITALRNLPQPYVTNNWHGTLAENSRNLRLDSQYRSLVMPVHYFIYKPHNEELHNLYSSPSIIRIIKSTRMRWAGHVARMGGKRNVYRLLVGKPDGKRPLGRPRRMWIDNIKMELLEIRVSVVDWIGLAQDRYRWRALVNSVMNLRVP